jgi:hypothetical protein
MVFNFHTCVSSTDCVELMVGLAVGVEVGETVGVEDGLAVGTLVGGEVGTLCMINTQN